MSSIYTVETGDTANASFASYATSAIGTDLFIGLGNQPAGTNGALVIRWNGSVLSSEHVLDEQGCHDMHEYAGELWVAGTDPTESWEFGNIYKRTALGVWAKIRTLPNTMHTWGLNHAANGDLLAATGSHVGDNATWVGQVMRSNEDGATWYQTSDATDYRAYDVIEFGARLYAIGYTLSLVKQLLYSTDGGANWFVESGVVPNRLPRILEWNGNLVVVDGDNSRLIIINNLFSVSYISTPSVMTDIVLNSLTTDGTDLFIITDDGHIWRTSDGIAWERFSYVDGAISISYWQSDNSLIVSDIGVNASLWRIPLS